MLPAHHPTLTAPKMRVFARLPDEFDLGGAPGLMLDVVGINLEASNVEVRHYLTSRRIDLSLTRCVALMRGGDVTDPAGNVLYEGDILLLDDEAATRAIVCFGKYHNGRNGGFRREGIGWYLRPYLAQGEEGYQAIKERRIEPLGTLHDTVRYAGHVFQAREPLALDTYRDETQRALDLTVSV